MLIKRTVEPEDHTYPELFRLFDYSDSILFDVEVREEEAGYKVLNWTATDYQGVPITKLIEHADVDEIIKGSQ